MASEVLICNLALARFSNKRIDALSDSDEEAVWCNQFFGHARDSVTQDAIWRHARGRQTLAELTNDRTDDFTYRYQRPSDCLRIRYILPETGTFDPRYLLRYEREGDSIYCDEPSARIIYIKQVTTPASFGPHFVNALSWYLAHLIVMPLKADRALMDTMLAGYAMERAKAIAMDEAEEHVIRTADESVPDWLQMR